MKRSVAMRKGLPILGVFRYVSPRNLLFISIIKCNKPKVVADGCGGRQDYKSNTSKHQV
jgi:hypothetical protein